MVSVDSHSDEEGGGAQKHAAAATSARRHGASKPRSILKAGAPASATSGAIRREGWAEYMRPMGTDRDDLVLLATGCAHPAVSVFGTAQLRTRFEGPFAWKGANPPTPRSVPVPVPDLKRELTSEDIIEQVIAMSRSRHTIGVSDAWSAADAWTSATSVASAVRRQRARLARSRRRARGSVDGAADATDGGTSTAEEEGDAVGDNADASSSDVSRSDSDDGADASPSDTEAGVSGQADTEASGSGQATRRGHPRAAGFGMRSPSAWASRPII